MGYVLIEAINYIKISAKGVKILNKKYNTVSKTHKYESCVLSKTHRIISRNSNKLKSSIKSFERVFFDFIHFKSIYNTHQWTSHLIYNYIDFNMIYIYTNKIDALRIFREIIKFIKKRYGYKIIYIYTNGEKVFDYIF